MSGVAVIRYMLAHNTPLLVAVPATKIMAGTFPVGFVLPGISVMKASNVPRNTLATVEPNRVYTERVQVSVEVKGPPEGQGYPQVNAIMVLVRAALPNFRGMLNGIIVESVLPDFEGPELPYPDLNIQSQSQDYMVKWKSGT